MAKTATPSTKPILAKAEKYGKKLQSALSKASKALEEAEAARKDLANAHAELTRALNGTPADPPESSENSDELE